MADIRDILDIERVPSTEGLRDSILGISDKTKLKKNVPSNVSKPPKRPEGMARELYALLCVDRKDAPPLLPTDTGMVPFCQIKTPILYYSSVIIIFVRITRMLAGLMTNVLIVI